MGRLAYHALRLTSSVGDKIIIHTSPKTDDFKAHLYSGLDKLMRSRYFWANVVYVIYSAGMLLINADAYSQHVNNVLYMVFGSFHIINSFMYLWVWMEYDISVFSMICFPDWLNVIGAVLYMATACMYDREYSSDDDGADWTEYFIYVRMLEFVASIIETFAAAGWVGQWYVEWLESERTLGKGLTLDDPDIWSNATIMVAAIYYLVYNAQLLGTDYAAYNTSVFYHTGDQWYFVNSIFYVLSSMRDCGLFWFMPTAGVYFPADMERFERVEEYEDDEEAAETKTDGSGGGHNNDIARSRSDSSAGGGAISLRALNPAAASAAASAETRAATAKRYQMTQVSAEVISPMQLATVDAMVSEVDATDVTHNALHNSGSGGSSSSSVGGSGTVAAAKTASAEMV